MYYRSRPMCVCAHRRSEWRRRQKNQNIIHKASNVGTGEGVSLQPLPHTPQTHRGRTPTQSDRATDQDLVPKQAHEVEERLSTCTRRRQGRPPAPDNHASGASPPSPTGAQYSAANRTRAPLSAAARHRTWRHVLLQ